MGEILGIGVTHFPGLMLPDAYMSSFLTRTLKSDRVPAEMKEPTHWPEPLRQELAANQDRKAAAEHRRRLGFFVKVPQHGASIGVIKQIHHRAMTAGGEDSVILIQPRCDDIGDTIGIFESG